MSPSGPPGTSLQAIVKAAGGCPGSNSDFRKETINSKKKLQSQSKNNHLLSTSSHNGNGYRPNSHHLTQQPTAASADPPPSDAERESKPSPESTEQKMEKLGQASSKNASASTRSQEDDCMNENEKNAKTPVRASLEHPHQVMSSKL